MPKYKVRFNVDVTVNARKDDFENAQGDALDLLQKALKNKNVEITNDEYADIEEV